MDRMFRSLAALACLLGLLGNSQCSSSGSDSTPAFATVTAVEDANRQPAASFSQSQEIHFVLSLRNRTTMDQAVLVQGCYPYYEVLVVKAGTSDVVATVSPQSAHCNHISLGGDPFTFQAGKTVNVAMDWDQTDASRQPVPAGDYEAIGGLICWDANVGYDTADCMPVNTAAAGLVLTPTTYRSMMVPFTIH